MDDDWCKIDVRVTTEENVFSVIDPALDARELISLMNWFQCLSEGKLPRFACNSFIEPNLEFEFLAAKNNSVRITIKLRLEMQPDFKLVQFGSKQPDWKLIFEVNSDQFSKILQGMNEAIKDYPIRSGKPQYQ